MSLIYGDKSGYQLCGKRRFVVYNSKTGEIANGDSEKVLTYSDGVITV
jgi:hypothetical protein